jgi:hypothetical protein
MGEGGGRERVGVKKLESGVSPEFAFEDLRRELVSRKYNYKTIKCYLKRARFVGLYFNSGEHLIGIKAIDQKGSAAFRVVREKGRTFTVSCPSFLRSIQIPCKEGTKIYKAGWDEKGKMVLVKIN